MLQVCLTRALDLACLVFKSILEISSSKSVGLAICPFLRSDLLRVLLFTIMHSRHDTHILHLKHTRLLSVLFCTIIYTRAVNMTRCSLYPTWSHPDKLCAAENLWLVCGFWCFVICRGAGAGARSGGGRGGHGGTGCRSSSSWRRGDWWYADRGWGGFGWDASGGDQRRAAAQGWGWGCGGAATAALTHRAGRGRLSSSTGRCSYSSRVPHLPGRLDLTDRLRLTTHVVVVFPVLMLAEGTTVASHTTTAARLTSFTATVPARLLREITQTSIITVLNTSVPRMQVIRMPLLLFSYLFEYCKGKYSFK